LVVFLLRPYTPAAAAAAAEAAGDARRRLELGGAVFCPVPGCAAAGTAGAAAAVATAAVATAATAAAATGSSNSSMSTSSSAQLGILFGASISIATASDRLTMGCSPAAPAASPATATAAAAALSPRDVAIHVDDATFAAYEDARTLLPIAIESARILGEAQAGAHTRTLFSST
jgi:hypothetical protein